MIQDPNVEILIKRHLNPLQKQISMLQIELDEIKIVLNKQKNIMDTLDIRDLIVTELKNNSFGTTDQTGNELIVLEDCDFKDVAEIIANKITKNN